MIELRGIHIEQGEFTLRDVSVTVPERSYGVLMGPNGCGKTTVLEIVCGLRPQTSGQVILCGRDVSNLKPGERGIGYVPQDRALFPAMKVRDQLAFSMVVRKAENSLIAERVDEMAELLSIGNLLDRFPQGLSGGEAQRVALGRALASHPSVLCLDEPLNAIDEELHGEICSLLEDLHQRTGVTVLHITHSRSEAQRLAKTLFRFENGQVVANGRQPREP